MALSASLLFYVLAIVCFALVIVAAPVAGLTAIELLALGLVAYVLGVIVP